MRQAPNALASLLRRIGAARRARSAACRGSGAPAAGRSAARLTLALAVGVAALLACALQGALTAAPAVAAPPITFAGPGFGAGQVNDPVSTAVDQSTGTVYVADSSNRRIDEFDSGGNFLQAFGYGLLDGADELQTCTTVCGAGFSLDNYPAQLGGQTIHPSSVAVDNGLLSPSYHDVYVSDSQNSRIEKFTPSGEFLLTFGGGVLDAGAAGTGDLASGSPIVTSVVTTSKRFVDGQTIAGTGIPANTRITAIGNEGTMTLSQAATVSGTGVAFTAPTPAAVNPNNEVQTVTVSGAPTDTFTISFMAPWPSAGVATTTPIPFDATAAEVQSELEALSTIGAGNVAVSGPGGGPWTVEFKGRYADTNVEQMFAAPLAGGLASVATTLGGASAFEICTKAELAEGNTCVAGASGNGPGELSTDMGTVQPLPIAVDGSGNVWVGDVNRIEEFSPEGAYLSEIALPGAGEVQSLAIDASGDFYLKSSGVAGIQKLEPSGTPFGSPYPLDASGHPNALALDSSGHLFVSDQLHGKATLLKFDSSGAQTEAFGAGEVIGSPTGNALAFCDTAGSLYVVSSASEQSSAAQIFAAPAPGPLVQFGATKATAIAKTAATLNATVNPEHAATTYHFQYITEAQFMADGESFGAGALATTESASIGEDFEPHAVSLAIGAGQLTPATVYRFRVVATNSNAPAGIAGETASFETLPPARIESTSVAEVTSTSAVLQAEVNPLGDATSYHFEYLTEAAFQADGESWVGPDQPTLLPAPDAAIGSGVKGVSVSQHPQGLQPHTVYRYRVVAVNALAPAGFAGPALTFTTQSAGGSLGAGGLPDARQWEMVSPPDKHGALINAIGNGTQAAVSGDGFAFVATAPTESEPPGYGGSENVLAARGSEGWRSLDIGIPHRTATGITIGEYPLFSQELSLGLVQPMGGFTPFAGGASEQTPYLRSDFAAGGAFCAESCYRPLLSGCPPLGEECAPAVQEHANVPPGTKFGTCIGRSCGPESLGATPDLSHVVLRSKTALIEGAPGNALYEWSAGTGSLSLVTGGFPWVWASARHAISNDGSRIVWSDNVDGAGHLFMHDMARGKTVQLDAVQGGTGSGAVTAVFQAASSDGSKVFFTDNQHLTPDSGGVSPTPGEGDLYECEIVEGAAGNLECRITDLTPVTPSGESARVLGLVVGVSEDGSYVYFVADAKLAEGAEKSTCIGSEPSAPNLLCNLYLSHDGVTSLIARLSGDDSPAWERVPGGLSHMPARVSPDGRYLAFMSDRPLTGYDNRDARTGLPDEEVYLYHAAGGAGEAGTLACASCDPTGARPLGVEAGQMTERLDGSEMWSESRGLAGSLPGWDLAYGNSGVFYQSRYLSNGGRLFFNSSDALVPQDTNGTGDVYEYEPPKSKETASSDTCTAESLTYSPRSDGCVGLISSGTSAEESGFLDASENGNDVFFFTNARLSAQDLDSARDVYDAHVCSTVSPCPPPAPPPPPACQGDACQSPVAAPNHPTPGSLTFQGPGNVVPSASTPAVKPKSVTRAQKLAAALRACRKKSKRKRPACEKQARRAYGPVGKAKKSAKGRK